MNYAIGELTDAWMAVEEEIASHGKIPLDPTINLAFAF
jgi:hypothetical protein